VYLHPNITTVWWQ